MSMNLEATMTLNAASMRRGLQEVLGNVAKLGAAFMGIRGVVEGFMGAIGRGGKLTDLSARTGIPVKDLVVLQQAFENVGAGAENVVPAVGEMQRVLSGLSRTSQRGQSILTQLGLDPEQLKTQPVQEQFRQIAAAMGSITDPAQQTAAAMLLFGDAGPSLKELFSNPDAITKTAAAMGTLPQQIQDSAARFDDLSDRMNVLKARARGIFTGMAAGLAPVLSQIAAQLESIDFGKIASGISDALGTIVEMFANGDIAEAAELAVGIGFSNAVNLLVGTLGNGTFWKGIGKVIAGSLAFLGGVLIEIFTTPLTALQAGMDVLIGNLANSLAHVFTTVILGPLKLVDLMTGNHMQKSLQAVLEKLGVVQNNVTFKDAYAARQKEGTWITDQGKAALSAGGALAKEGARNVAAGMRSRDVMGVEGLQGQLAALWRKNQDAAAARAAQTKPAENPKPTGSVDHLTLDNGVPKAAGGGGLGSTGDAMARIGAYVGGQGGSGLDYARRTANGVEQLVRLYTPIGSSITSVPVWG